MDKTRLTELVNAVETVTKRKEAIALTEEEISAKPVTMVEVDPDQMRGLLVGLDLDLEALDLIARRHAVVVIKTLDNDIQSDEEFDLRDAVLNALCTLWSDGLITGLILAEQRMTGKKTP